MLGAGWARLFVGNEKRYVNKNWTNAIYLFQFFIFNSIFRFFSDTNAIEIDCMVSCPPAVYRICPILLYTLFFPFLLLFHIFVGARANAFIFSLCLFCTCHVCDWTLLVRCSYAWNRDRSRYCKRASCLRLYQIIVEQTMKFKNEMLRSAAFPISHKKKHFFFSCSRFAHIIVNNHHARIRMAANNKWMRLQSHTNAQFGLSYFFYFFFPSNIVAT